MVTLARGYETKTAAKLAADLQARTKTAMEITAVRIAADLRASAEPYVDTGATQASVHVEVYGGLSAGTGGFRNVGMIATADSPAAEYLDQGTRSEIRRPSGANMPVGARSPNRPNAPVKGVTKLPVVSGQRATGWFSRPKGIPLNEHMRNVFAGVYRRMR